MTKRVPVEMRSIGPGISCVSGRLEHAVETGRADMKADNRPLTGNGSPPDQRRARNQRGDMKTRGSAIARSRSRNSAQDSTQIERNAARWRSADATSPSIR